MDICDNFRGVHRPYHRHCNQTPALHNGFLLAGVANTLRRRGGACGQTLRDALDRTRAEMAARTARSDADRPLQFAPLAHVPEIYALAPQTRPKVGRGAHDRL
eukprot:3379358-Prymnesium_polylepis.1